MADTPLLAAGSRPVYLRAGDTLCAAGRGLAAAADACLNLSTTPAQIEFSSLGVPVHLPYFRIAAERHGPDADLLRLARDVIRVAQLDARDAQKLVNTMTAGNYSPTTIAHAIAERKGYSP